MKFIKRGISKIVFRFIKPPVKFSYVEVYNTYAQAGEDRVLSFLFDTLGIYHPFYIDIGANKPDWSSNTYLFYLKGAKGISIEPDKILFDKFKVARPNDICLNMAVGFDGKTEADFFVFDEPSLNTLSEEEAISRNKIGEFKVVEKIKVTVIRVEQIIEEYCPKLPDFISLDVEGIDFDILKSFDFENYPVPVWVVETIDYSPNPQKVKNYEVIEYMKTKGYFVYGDTYINTIFVNKNWFENYPK